MRRTAVVTDSTAGPVPASVAVVGLDVVVDGAALGESDTDTPRLLEAMAAGAAVGTSRPSPDGFARAYAAAAAAGASAVVSVHLSGALSGTVEAARLAAAGAPLRVEVVDTAAVGAVLTGAVAAAAALADDGADAGRVAAVARAVGELSWTWVSPGAAAHLQRGGRGTDPQDDARGLLSARAVLVVQDGRLVPLERARTLGRVLDRLRDLVADSLTDVAIGGTARVERLVVQHAGADAAAADLLTRLRGLPGTAGLHVDVVPLSPVLAAHVGPGAIGVAVVVVPGGRPLR